MDFVVTHAQNKDLRRIQSILNRARLSPNLSRCLYVLKARRMGKIIGAIGVEFWGPYVSLRALVVDKEYKRRGVGKALVRAALKLSRKRRVRGIYAYTLFWNIRFFKSCGFERIPKEEAPAEVQESVRFHHPHYRYCCLLKYRG